MSARQPLSLYIHIPFCVHKCGYCDFNSWAEERLAPQKQWFDAIQRQIQFWAPQIDREKFSIQTIFLGGGTPSLLNNSILFDLGQVLRDALPLAPDLEFTAEANPETIDLEKLETLTSAGVNRISVGIQSFRDHHLDRLERRARRQHNLTVLDLISKNWRHRWSLDLMFGLPGQTLNEWKEDLETALSFSPNHLSAYQLTLTTERSKSWDQPVEEKLLEMFDWAESFLGSHGRPKYEVSNFATPGHESLHNLAYWKLNPFLGLGPGASGLLPPSLSLDRAESRFGVHQKNPDRFEVWMQGAGDSIAEQKHLTPRSGQDHAFELLMMNLRLAEGIPEHRLGSSLALIRDLSKQRHLSNLIHFNDQKLKTTAIGSRLLDSVLSQLTAPLVDFAGFDPRFGVSGT